MSFSDTTIVNMARAITKDVIDDLENRQYEKMLSLVKDSIYHQFNGQIDDNLLDELAIIIKDNIYMHPSQICSKIAQ